MAITHPFVSAISDGSDTNLLRPLNWNAAHTIENDTITYAKMQDVSATDKLLGRSTAGSGDVEEIACTVFGRSIIDDASEAAFKATVNLEIGTDVQAYDATLTSIAALGTAADKIAYTTALDTWAEAALTAAARTVLDDATVATMVDTLGGAASTGSGGLARATSPTFITPLLGTPTSGVLTNCTGLPTAGLVDDAVTYAKMQNISATDKLLGRATAGAGDVEEIACTAAGRALIDDADTAAQRVTLEISKVFHVRDEKASGTAGGSSVAGIQTRVLNTVVLNEITGASLATNQVTLPAGTFKVSGHAPSYTSSFIRIALYNVTDAAYTILGISGYGHNATAAPASVSFLFGKFTITAAKVFELRHYTSGAQANDGLGVPSSSGIGNEVFAELFIEKV